jgi:hypothetical protein
MTCHEGEVEEGEDEDQLEVGEDKEVLPRGAQ